MKTKPGDIVLIYHRGQEAGYARVEEIIADVKPEWWQISLLFLQLPLRNVTWILREEYIDGQEFTMGGDLLRLEPLPPPPGWAEMVSRQEESAEKPEDQPGGKVLQLHRRKEPQ